MRDQGNAELDEETHSDIGRRKEMTKPPAKRKLRLLVDEMASNKDAAVLRAFDRTTTCKERDTKWEETDLIMCKSSSANIPT